MDRIISCKKIKIHISRAHLLMALPGFFYLANLLRMLDVSLWLYYIAFAVSGIVGMVYLSVQRRRELKFIILFALLYITSLVLNWLIIKNFGAGSIINNMLFIGIAVIMILQPWTLPYGAFVFYATTALILYSMSVSSSTRILTSSANFVSVVMLLSCSFYYIALGRENRKLRLLDLLPAGLCLFISVWARGRGGILSATVLLVLLLFLYLKTITDKNAKKTVILLSVLLFAAVFMYAKNISLIDAFLGLGKWEERGTDNSARLNIWGSYLSKTKESIVYFLFGAPLRDIPLIESYSGNTHNSFLQLHAYTGIVTFAFVIFLSFRALLYYLKTKNTIIAIMMGTILLRSLTDKFVFGQYGMPIMLFFILYPFADSCTRKDKTGDLSAGTFA